MTYLKTDVEKGLLRSAGRRIEEALCVATSNGFDAATRLAITQAKLGGRAAEMHIGGALVFDLQPVSS